MSTTPSLETALTALEGGIRRCRPGGFGPAGPSQRMDAAGRLAGIAERHLGMASRMQHEEVLLCQGRRQRGSRTVSAAVTRPNHG
jgi:hypothetical protein